MSMAVGEAHILNICVAPDQRRQGMAGFLLRHLLMVAHAAGVTLVLIEVSQSNDAAQKLYMDFCFAKIGERRDYNPAREGREGAIAIGSATCRERGCKYVYNTVVTVSLNKKTQKKQIIEHL